MNFYQALAIEEKNLVIVRDVSVFETNINATMIGPSKVYYPSAMIETISLVSEAAKIKEWSKNRNGWRREYQSGFSF